MQNVVNDDGAGFERDRLPQSERAKDDPLDLAFLDAQTFADHHLQRDVLSLFLEQGRRIVPGLRSLTEREQADAAHLLKGSARGIGAWTVAALAESYEAASPDARARLWPDLADAFASVDAAILAHLTVLSA